MKHQLKIGRRDYSDPRRRSFGLACEDVLIGPVLALKETSEYVKDVKEYEEKTFRDELKVPVCKTGVE